MDNQQLYNLSNNQKQLILVGKLGDGTLYRRKKSHNAYYSTNCKYKEYLEFKSKILNDLSFNITSLNKNGYAKTKIYCLQSKRHVYITKVLNMSLEEILNSLDAFGLAIWFYDDGSLHKTKLFYNLNTHKFSLEDNILIQKYLSKWDINSKITKETKKDGRVFYYQRIGKFDGAFEISKILSTVNLDCYRYKLWSSETILKWSKLQEKLKSTDKVYTNNQLGKLLCKI